MTEDSPEYNAQDDDRLSGPLAAAVRSICRGAAPQDVQSRVLAAAAAWKAPVIRRRDRSAGLLALATSVCAVLAAVILLLVTQRAPSLTVTDQSVAQSLPGPEVSDIGTQAAPAGSRSTDDSMLLGMRTPVAGATPSASTGVETPTGGFGFGVDAGSRTGLTHAGVPGPMDGFGGGERGLGGITLGARVNPAPLYAVAADAPVVVSLGGAQPLRLGGQWIDDGTHLLHIWDWSQSDMSRRLGTEQHGNPAAVSPDGKWIITFEGLKIDAASGAIERIEPPFGDGVQKVRFSPDGRTLALWVVRGNYQGAVRLLDFPSCAPRAEIPDVFGYMFAVAFTADGNELVLMDKEMFIRRWDALTGVELQKFDVPHTNSIRALAVSPDGRWVASAGPEGEIFLRDAQTGAQRHRLNAKPKIGPEIVFSLRFSPDGNRLAGGGIEDLFVWNCESGEPVRKFQAAPRDIRFSDDGRRITTVSDSYGSRDEKGQDTWGYPAVQHWDVETGQAVAAAPVEDPIDLDRLVTGFDEVSAFDAAASVHVLVGVTSAQTLLDKVVGAVRTLPAGEVSAGVFVSGSTEAGVFIAFDDTDAGRQARERVVQALNAAEVPIKEQFARNSRSLVYYGAVPSDYAITPPAGSPP